MRSERAEVPEPVVSPLAIRPGVAAAIQRVDVTVGFLRAPVEFLAAVLLLLGFIRVRIFALFWSRRGVRIIALIGLRRPVPRPFDPSDRQAAGHSHDRA